MRKIVEAEEGSPVSAMCYGGLAHWGSWAARQRSPLREQPLFVVLPSIFPTRLLCRSFALNLDRNSLAQLTAREEQLFWLKGLCYSKILYRCLNQSSPYRWTSNSSGFAVSTNMKELLYVVGVTVLTPSWPTIDHTARRFLSCSSTWGWSLQL